MAKCSVVWHGAEEYDVKNEHQDTEPERGGEEGTYLCLLLGARGAGVEVAACAHGGGDVGRGAIRRRARAVTRGRAGGGCSVHGMG